MTVLLALGLALPVLASDAQPITQKPHTAAADSKGLCRKGTSQCRWGGDCVEKQDICYNCPKGMKFSHRLGCYECPANRTAFEQGDDIVCKSNLRKRTLIR
ncbi:hypothetical protein [Minwuia sp.]|uniref:hypothetical protein n=1 Tax=Minwuia sp. TaxID=2493630 RepID=UPI003A933DB2